jgi:hypothetical protein
LDLLRQLQLQLLGWDVRVPAQQAAEWDEERIAAWRVQTCPEVEDGGGPGRLAGVRRRVRPRPEAAEGAFALQWVPMSAANSLRLSLTGLGGHRAQYTFAADLPTHTGRGRRKGMTEADYGALLDAAHRQLGGPIVLVRGNLNTTLARR